MNDLSVEPRRGNERYIPPQTNERLDSYYSFKFGLLFVKLLVKRNYFCHYTLSSAVEPSFKCDPLCDVNAVCKNSTGEPECMCKAGFDGNGTTCIG